MSTKNVWLFVHAMSMAGSSSFGKTLFTRRLHNILNERHDLTRFSRFLSAFWD
jgi:nicotinamide riboside kinase